MRRVSRFFSLLLAAASLVSLLSACGKTKEPPYLSLLETTRDASGCMLMHISCVDPEEKAGTELAELSYTAQYPLSVYDKSSGLIYYSSRVETDTSYGDQLFSYDPETDAATQLTTNLYGINYILPAEDVVYLLVCVQGTHHLTPAIYRKDTGELSVYNQEGTWYFDLLSYDVYHGRLFAAAALKEEYDACLNEANEKGETYVPPDYTIFSFSAEDFSHPTQVFTSERQLVRRMAPRPDGTLFFTLADGIPLDEPAYHSYLLDPATGKCSETANIDDLMYITEFLSFPTDNNTAYFIGTEDAETAEEEVRRLYAYSFATKELELVYDSDKGYINNCFLLR